MLFDCSLRSQPGASKPGLLLNAIRLPASFCLLGLALLSGGCASTNEQPSGVAGPQPMAQASGPRANMAMKVEIEADGLPSQLAPRNRAPVADDPTQPWSPNYGSAPALGAPPSMSPAIPAATPAKTATLDTTRLARQLHHASAPVPPPLYTNPMSEDDIIRRAIAEHEMRRN